MSAALVVWRFLDGKPGHEKQSAGLLQGMEAALSAVRDAAVGSGASCADVPALHVHDFDMRFKPFLWRQIRGHALHGSADVPRPRLVLGAGHRTHLPILLARAFCGGHGVALMKPSLPHRLFDLIFVPQHDRFRNHARLIATRGVICPSADGADSPSRAADQGLILLGGANRHFEWDNRAVAAQIAAVAQAAVDVQWQICDSRRTPADMIEAVPELSNLAYLPQQSTGGDFLQRALASASRVWVTADSASMIYEALSAGARVGVIDLPLKRPQRDNKHLQGIRLLRTEGHISSTQDGFRLVDQAAGACFAPENRRCGRIVVERLLGLAQGDCI